MTDTAERLRGLGVCVSGCNGRCQECPQQVANYAATELDALTLALAAERERVKALEEGLRPFAAISLQRDEGPPRNFDSRPDMIDAPDLAITPKDVRRARTLLSASLPQPARTMPKLEWRYNSHDEDRAALYLGNIFVGAISQWAEKNHPPGLPFGAILSSNDCDGDFLGHFASADEARAAVETAALNALENPHV